MFCQYVMSFILRQHQNYSFHRLSTEMSFSIFLCLSGSSFHSEHTQIADSDPLELRNSVVDALPVAPEESALGVTLLAVDIPSYCLAHILRFVVELAA